MLVILIVILTVNVTRSALLSLANEEENHFRRHQRATSCILPQHPDHGFLTSDVPLASPGQSYEGLQVNVTCEPGYGVVGSSYVFCYKGYWSQIVPDCVRLCKLEKDPSVHYRCIDQGSEEGRRDCNLYEPSGTIVRPVCNTPNYYAHDILPFMRCNEGRWSYIAKCTPECGRVTPGGAQLVAGGRTAKRGELPWHAGIYRKTFNPYMQICGGSLVSNTVVISAAHCFYVTKLLPASEFAVAVGKLYRPYNDQIDDEDGAQKSDVKEIKIPSRFQGRPANFQEDIALLYLATAIVYQTYVRPICLDFDYAFDRRHLLPGNIGKVAGWGLTDVNGPAAVTLKVVELPYIDIAQCLAKSPNTFAEYITGDKICAGYQNKGTAVCRGDSGGGLVFPAMSDRGFERYYLRGVVSTAPDDHNLCNTQTFTAFTQVLKHEHFITANLHIYNSETTVECLPDEWSCADGTCIPSQKRCDGVTNCPDNSDETNPGCRDAVNLLTSPEALIRKSQQKCFQYRKQAAGRTCTEAPYMALLGYGQDRSKTDWWGRVGVIISDRYILLVGWVAEYFSTVINNGVKRVALGVTKRSDPQTDWQIHEVAASMLHPGYTHPQNDIALLRLQTTIQFNDRVQPACLPTAAVNDAEGLVTTWYDRHTGKSGDILHSVTVEKYSKEECAASDTRYNASTHNCYANRADLVESCTWIGDPLVESKRGACVHTVLGVSSYWSEQCSLPYAYLMVNKYIPWVASIVWP